MNCTAVRTLLVSYLDGEVTTRQSHSIQQHLKFCADCCEEMAVITGIRTSISQALQSLAADVQPSPQTWSHIQARLPKDPIPDQQISKPWHSGMAPARSRIKKIINTGEITMRKYGFAALSIIGIMAVMAIFMTKITSVSAQQILDKATAVQSETEGTPGIRHVRFEEYQNPHAFEDGAGTTVVTEIYFDNTVSKYRWVTEDSTGNILNVIATDGSFVYETKVTDEETGVERLVVYRTAYAKDEQKSGKRNIDPDAAAKAVFDQFNNNPRVKLEGKITWSDGSQAYVLVEDNYQTLQNPDGDDEKIQTGTMKMVFNCQTYQLLESRLTIRKNGQDVLVNSVRYLVNEVLPESSPVAWDLSDLKGIDIVDDTAQENAQDEAAPEQISQQELLSHTRCYVLKTIPEGFQQEIYAAPNQPADEPYAYEIYYKNEAGKYFSLQADSNESDYFIETNFYDGSYKTISGLVLHFSPAGNESQNDGDYTAAILTTPENLDYLLISTLSRQEVQELTEDLVLVPSTTAVSTAVKNNSQSNIEYAKKTLYNADGNIASVIETWSNPATHDERSDFSELDNGSGSLTRFGGGAYVLNNGTQYIKYDKDSQGKLSGTSMEMSSSNSASIIVTGYQEYINEYKEGTRRAGWNNEGSVKTADGRELNKITRSDKSAMPGEEGKTYIENVYLDKNSGLPVKGDISVEQNGTITLLYTYIYEFKNVSDDGSLFDTKGINLKKLN